MCSNIGDEADPRQRDDRGEDGCVGPVCFASDALLTGLVLAPIMVVGSFVGKRVLDNLPEQAVVVLIESVLILSGALLLL